MPSDPLEHYIDGLMSEDDEVRYEILDSNGKSKSDREKEQKKKKKMTRTHRIVKEEE